VEYSIVVVDADALAKQLDCILNVTIICTIISDQPHGTEGPFSEDGGLGLPRCRAGGGNVVISRQIILLGTGCVGDEGRAIPCVGHAGGEARYQVEQGHLILSGTRINQDSTDLEGVRRLLRLDPGVKPGQHPY
jgi:hypothetical protein